MLMMDFATSVQRYGVLQPSQRPRGWPLQTSVRSPASGAGPGRLWPQRRPTRRIYTFVHYLATPLLRLTRVAHHLSRSTLELAQQMIESELRAVRYFICVYCQLLLRG